MFGGYGPSSGGNDKRGAWTAPRMCWLLPARASESAFLLFGCPRVLPCSAACGFVPLRIRKGCCGGGGGEGRRRILITHSPLKSKPEAAPTQVMLALVQQRRVIVRDFWTSEMRARQLRVWRRRQLTFWALWFSIFAFFVLCILSCLANVGTLDAAKWLESTGMSVLQDLALKPMLLAVCQRQRRAAADTSGRGEHRFRRRRAECR